MFNKITFKYKIIFLSFLLLIISALYVFSLNYGFKFLTKKPSQSPDINVATPSGTVTFNIVKLTADPISPSTSVKYAVRVSSSGAVNVSALGFKLKSSLPISNYVMGTPIVSGIEVKDLSYDSVAGTLSFVAATKTWFQIGNNADLITFDVTSPAAAGTYNSILTKVTNTALPSLIDSNNNEILNSNSLAAVNLVVANSNPIPVGNLDSVNCQEITGWSCDSSNYSTALDIHVYADGPYGTGTMVASGKANTNRGDVTSYCGGVSTHGYTIPFPTNLMDGKAHTIYTYAIDIPSSTQNPVLPNSGKSVTCYPAPTTAPANFKAACNLDGTQVTLSWTALSGAAKYYLRNDNTSNAWPNGAGDYYDDNVTATTKTISLTKGASYHAWVHGVSSTGAVGPLSEINYTCNSNTGPTIGNLMLKNSYLTANDGIVMSFSDNGLIGVNGVGDSDGVKSVVFYKADTNTVLANLTTGSSGTYTFANSGFPIGKYTIRVVATDNNNITSTKDFPYYFYIRPAAPSITPFGGTYVTLPNITITSNNPSNTTLLYDFCTTDCATKVIDPSKKYVAPFASKEGSAVVSYVTDATSGLQSSRVYTLAFNLRTPGVTPTPVPEKVNTPNLSLRPGPYIYYANNSAENKTITLTTGTSGATIQYCLGTLTSSSCSAYSTYTAPIVVNKNFKLYAKAIKSGATDSDIATGVYQLLGDLNSDNVYNVNGDIIPLLKAIFDSVLQNVTLMDMNRDSIIDMRDLIILLNIIFA